MKALGKTFSSSNGEVIALKNINLQINKGDIFGIIGMSGAGKSTLVRCINYLEKPTEGEIWFGDKELGSLDQKSLRQVRQSMGMIFQQFNLWMQRTVLSNICFPLEIAGVSKSEASLRAEELLKLVGLENKAEAYPSQLSGGQKQRVAIARALATNPKVLLCDEATSALDPTTTESILALLKDINQRLGITIIIITHEMSVVEKICSHVAIIDKSQIAEAGRVHDIFTHPKTLAAQKLVYPNDNRINHLIGKRCCRIIFDGSSSYDPAVARMILECKVLVNILYADMKNIDGRAFGELIIQLPEDETSADKVISYLSSKSLQVEEVSGYVE
ncbi:methionine ABC transporter ATP-binding protein [Cellulosilyticum sp. I15G10I2]|uniref:methionine ABC transporter ATP-binding protein n=1 Tax=Cellulosilyticum sp. I15G10I2 TaxID=1892843 RepID=UPI00085CB203